MNWQIMPFSSPPPPQSNSPATAQRSRRIRIKNRRRRYLELHPEYLDSPALELADPLAYDRLIRRFQSIAEREAAGRRKGLAGTLEAGLLLGVKVDAVQAGQEGRRNGGRVEEIDDEQDEEAYEDEGEEDVNDAAAVPKNKAEGERWWRRRMEARFLSGADEDFEYEVEVDGNEQLDDRERAWEDGRAEERWFEGEEEAEAEAEAEKWSIEKEGRDEDGDDGMARRTGKKRVVLLGQTGVQDF